MKKKWRLRRNEGQSLVEMAMTLPLLLLMFVGLIEIGAALRDYLIVVNANREGTRFAARGRWFDSEEEVQEIFKRVIAAAGVEQRGGELVQFLRPLDIGELRENTVIAVHYIQVPDQVDLETGASVVEPVIINGPWYTGTLPYPDSQVDAARVAEQARQENYDFNNQYYVTERLLDIPSADDFVIVEIWFKHEQLLKLPLFTKTFLPEEFTLYARSQMRVTLDTRVE
jgi:hypothetical protein